ncbi:MAG: hypothetical protein M3304_11900, partial [Actinomycetota bacterium]|nr:hypothetical protein [Actinomycetota bacterium]
PSSAPADASPGESATSKSSFRRRRPRHNRAVTPLVDEQRPQGAPTALDPEAGRSRDVVWLHRDLGDPIPRINRLSPAFARELRAVSRRAGVRWGLLLAIVRAEGQKGSAPAGSTGLTRLARRIRSVIDARNTRRPWAVAFAYSGRTAFADRVAALARLHRAIGLRGLVVGLHASKRRLIRSVLADRKIEIYSAGRADIAAGRVDVRVLVLLRYLRFAHGSVTVSSLVSGHRLFARPGVVSAHVYGLAVDVSALGGVPIAGHQGPNGLTERAVRNILLLPPELAPQQVISLLGLGVTSFALADHDDHIHVGY